jgi:hypothetical protein
MTNGPVVRWPRLVAGLIGAILLLAGAASILLGKGGLPTIVLVIVAAPLVYAGADMPLPKINAGGVTLSFGHDHAERHRPPPRTGCRRVGRR